MHRFEPTLTVLQTRRAANTTRRKIGSGVPEGLGGDHTPHCGAVTGESAHGPMT